MAFGSFQPHIDILITQNKMAAMVNISALPMFRSVALKLKPDLINPSFLLLPSNCFSNLFINGSSKKPQALWPTSFTVLCNGLKNGKLCSTTEINEQINVEEVAEFDVDGDNYQLGLQRETILYSFNPFPLLLLATLLPGASTVGSLFGPFVELVNSWNLPYWLVHWGHPANMVVVLFAMGGYGTYLGFLIRSSDDLGEKAKAKDLHPKLMAGMFFFFALGATGGIISLLTSDRPIFESPHAVTGIVGLALLTIQTILPTLFEGNPRLRNVHGVLGSGIMTLFLVHAALGLQLGLSY